VWDIGHALGSASFPEPCEGGFSGALGQELASKVARSPLVA
jgi:hypothetical protein